MTNLTPTSKTDITTRTSIVVHELHRQLCALMGDTQDEREEALLGIILGTAMFCDSEIGPFRTQRLFQQAETIVLQTDANVTDVVARKAIPDLKEFGQHLQCFAELALRNP